MITSGEGKYKVWLKRDDCGDDLVYVLGGGEKSHVGCVVVCKPGESPTVINFKDHYDHEVIEPLALAACEKYGKTVVVLGGVHIDNATKDEIDILVKNCMELIKCI